MNDSQIVAISITVLAILAGILVNNGRLTDFKELFRAEIGATEARMEVRFTVIETKMETRFASMENHMEARFAAMDAKIDAKLAAMDAKMETRFESMDRKLDAILQLVAGHETRIQKLEHPVET